MKKLVSSAVIILTIFLSVNLQAQAPPPPPPDHGSTGNQNGGNAPIGSGIAILLTAAGVYGVRKYYNNKIEDLDD